MRMRNKLKTLWVFLLLCCSTIVNATAKLDALSITASKEGKTSVIFSLTGAFSYKVFKLTNPQRIVVDLDQTKINMSFHKNLLANSQIQNIRSGYQNQHTLRLVFDMKQDVNISSSRLSRGLRVDLMPSKPHGYSSVESPQLIKEHILPIPQTNHVNKLPIQVRHGPSKTLRDVVIVLDPGHGGKDPGAIGPRRNAEKNVVLAIALKLKQIINRQPGMHAVLTRNGDYYIGLRERLNIARKYNADIFISIHADAFINQHSHGASVFALSQRGATSEAARWLAEKENNSELGGVNLSNLDDQNGLIRTVLIDLSQTATITASVQMGSRVLQNLDHITNLHNEKVEQARFVVLKSPDIPSILIETGFISNPHEESNLTSPAYQARLTQAIFNGIKRYFWDYPPQGTRVEVLSGVNTHVVRAGDSLPVIAEHYHVSVASIKEANHLSHNRLKTGQKLSIPMSWG